MEAIHGAAIAMALEDGVVLSSALSLQLPMCLDP